MTEWCECSDYRGYTALDVYGHLPFVHAACGKPTLPTWLGQEDYCEECGKSFSSPTEEICKRCHSLWMASDRPWESWAVLWQRHEEMISGFGTLSLDPLS